MPDWAALVRARIASLAIDPRRERDVVDELTQHVAEHYAELVASGRTEAEALAAALAPLDDPRQLAAELARAGRPSTPVPPAEGGSIAGNVARDIRYAARLLRRAPGFAAAAIVTLALGVGANTAIFSVVRAVMLRPPPYRDPGRLLVFLNGRSGPPRILESSSLPDYEDWRRRLTSFEDIGILSGWTFNISGLALPERAYGARVSGSLFRILGGQPLLGRGIEPADDGPRGTEVVVLGYRVWQRLFGGDPNVVGRSLMMEGRPHVVVGVMPARFRFPSDDVELWAAIRDNMSGMPRNSRFMVAVGRLRAGASQASAQAEVDTLTTQLERAYPDTNKGWRVRLATVQTAAVGDTKPALLLLAGAVGLVLLLACANVSNLLLARAASRRRETAIRLALGAGRGRLLAQWLAENLVLSTLGGACGVAIAYGAVALVVAYGPANVPRLDETAVDGAVLAFAFAVATLAGVVAAIAPALAAVRASSPSALNDRGETTAPSRRSAAVLIVAEVAIAMTLAVAGALLLRSFARLTAVTPGFDPQHVLSLKVFLGPPHYRSVASAKQYIQTALDRMSAISGVESAAAVSELPIADPLSGQHFEIEGHATAPPDRPMGAYRPISATYFRTMRIPIVRGRGFTDDDREDTDPVVIVNEAAARRYWPAADPIGQRIRWSTLVPEFDRAPLTIVGVVGDVKSSGLDKPEQPAVYGPFTQRRFPWLRWNSFVVRTQGAPAMYAQIIREELARIDRDQPVYQVAAFDDVIADSLGTRRFLTGLIDLFAALALALCAVGVYGAIGCWVGDRTRELGVRMALGATARGIRAMVVSRALGLTAIGLAIGAALSAFAGRFLSTLLFGIRPFDPSTVAIVASAVLATSAAAAYLPARRASTVDPLTVIRGDQP